MKDLSNTALAVLGLFICAGAWTGLVAFGQAPVDPLVNFYEKGAYGLALFLYHANIQKGA
ncbi:MAG: hypothetical protein JO142_02325 [Burkholderiales bacterium]|nr:hypothetical protein [Burkholderiales bacterium]